MDEKYTKRLLGYLSHFGRASFLRPNFENPRAIDFAGIELITSEEIAERLVNGINSHLSAESGSRAFLRYVTWNTIDNGRYKHVVEIIPYPFVPVSEYKEATEEVLKSLPKIIKNYRMKKPN